MYGWTLTDSSYQFYRAMPESVLRLIKLECGLTEPRSKKRDFPKVEPYLDYLPPHLVRMLRLEFRMEEPKHPI